jgi:hypothetical protein
MAETTSFQRDIRPLFRQVDVEHMRPMGVLLDDYDFMSQRDNAEKVRDQITGKRQPQMPPDGTWPQEQIDLLSRWVADGCPA